MKIIKDVALSKTSFYLKGYAAIVIPSHGFLVDTVLRDCNMNVRQS